MNNQPIPIQSGPIGILDSGVGGLSIWRDIIAQLPHEATVYIADSKYCPYGPREQAEILQLSRRLVQFLLEQEVKLIVVACNTITVSCLDQLRAEFPQIPLIGAVPVVKTAAEKTRNKKIGIFSTTRTAESLYQKALLDTYVRDYDVTNIGTDRLVPFIERGKIESKAFMDVLRDALKPFQEKGVDTVALGCSHYPFARKQIEAVLGAGVTLLDSGAAIARQVSRVLTQNGALAASEKPTHTLYTTGDREQFIHTVTLLLGYNTVQDVKILNANS